MTFSFIDKRNDQFNHRLNNKSKYRFFIFLSVSLTLLSYYNIIVLSLNVVHPNVFRWTRSQLFILNFIIWIREHSSKNIDIILLCVTYRISNGYKISEISRPAWVINVCFPRLWRNSGELYTSIHYTYYILYNNITLYDVI